MGWLREHTTLLYGIGVGLVVLTGAVLVSNKFATNTETTQYTWGSYGGAGRFISSEVFDTSLTDPLPLEEQFNIADLYRNLETNPDRTHASFVSGTPSTVGELNDLITSGEVFEFGEQSIEEFLASITPSASTQALFTDSDQESAYYYIPKTLSTGPVRTTFEMTDAERALYNYGNDAGAPIELYGTLWGNTQAFVHRGFVEDRDDPKKREDLLKLAGGLSDVSMSLKDLDFMPGEVTKYHADIVDAYAAVAEKTRALAQTQTDEELLTAIEDYNAAADEFLRAYLSLSNVFLLNNITYPETEPGRVFVYSGQPAQ
jgi:hypothetical protein